MAEPIIESALRAIDTIDPRIRVGLAPAPAHQLEDLRCVAAVDVPPEYLDFFAVMGGNADIIFGDAFTVGIADALQFYRADLLSRDPLTSTRFFYLGTVDVGTPYPERVFLQSHEPDQLYWGEFEGPRPILRTSTNPERERTPFFADIQELIVFQAWRLHRVRAFPHVAQISVSADSEAALDELAQINASFGIVDTGLLAFSRCLEGPNHAIALHRSDPQNPGWFTLDIGGADPKSIEHLLALIEDHLPSSGRRRGSVAYI